MNRGVTEIGGQTFLACSEPVQPVQFTQASPSIERVVEAHIGKLFDLVPNIVVFNVLMQRYSCEGVRRQHSSREACRYQ
jgi:hypothetical protein